MSKYNQMNDATLVRTIQWGQRVLSDDEIPGHVVAGVTEISEEAFATLEGRYGKLNVEIDADQTVRLFVQDDHLAWIQLSNEEQG